MRSADCDKRSCSLLLCLVAAVVALLAAGCAAAPETLPSPTMASVPRDSWPVLAPRRVALGEVVEIDDLHATVLSGVTYCEIGNDPVPCTRFVVDVPRAGTVTIRMDSASHEPMFIEVGNLAVEHLSFVTGRAPLVTRDTVPAGALPFRAGPYAPWGIRGAVVRFRLVATLD